MAFRKKAAQILKHQPDILVVQECEHHKKVNLEPGMPKPNASLWFGANPHKGLGIFSYNNYRFKVLRKHDRNIKMVVPIAVTGGPIDFILFAIWANNPTDPDGQYVEQVWKAIHYYERQLTGKPAILIGDFNSNTIWDRKKRAANHSNVVKYLEDRAIFSTYHLHHKQAQGKELHPTLYLYRHKDKPYHIDYCFMSQELAETVEHVEVGDYDFWRKYSDHVPLMVTLGNNNTR
jgi:exodeoxyribonuclease III